MAPATLRDAAVGRDGEAAGRLALLGFLAGILSVLVFHQGTVWLLNQAGVLPNGPFRFTPIAPFGVPQIVNQAFWGGLWGVLVPLFVVIAGFGMSQPNAGAEALKVDRTRAGATSALLGFGSFGVGALAGVAQQVVGGGPLRAMAAVILGALLLALAAFLVVTPRERAAG